LNNLTILVIGCEKVLKSSVILAIVIKNGFWILGLPYLLFTATIHRQYMTLGIRNTRVDVFNISVLGTKRVNHRRSLLQHEPTAKNPVIRILLLLLLLLLLFPFSSLTPTGSYGYAPTAMTGGWLRHRVLLYSRLKRASEVKSS